MTVEELNKKYLIGYHTSVVQIDCIAMLDKDWIKLFTDSLDECPQRKGVVLDCIEYKFNELTQKKNSDTAQ